MKYVLIAAAALYLTGVTDLVAAECNPSARAVAFSQAMQAVAAKDPAKLAALQPKVQALSAEAGKLAAEGKMDEICKRYDALEADLKK